MEFKKRGWGRVDLDLRPLILGTSTLATRPRPSQPMLIVTRSLDEYSFLHVRFEKAAISPKFKDPKNDPGIHLIFGMTLCNFALFIPFVISCWGSCLQ